LNMIPTADHVKIHRSYVLSLNKLGCHRVEYLEFGNLDSDVVVVCIAGFVATADSFLKLDEYVGKSCRIVALNLPGRGNSDKLPHYSLYCTDTYINDISHVVAALTSKSIKKLRFILYGHSLSAHMAIIFTSLPNNPFEKLIVGDVGPELSHEYIHRMSNRLLPEMSVDAVRNFCEYLKAKKLPRDISPEYIEIYKNSVFKFNEQTHMYTLNFDCVPVAKQLRELHPLSAVSTELWNEWERISIPILVLHCENSEVLSSRQVERMMKYPSKIVRYHQIKGFSHLLFYYDEELSNIILNFINN